RRARPGRSLGFRGRVPVRGYRDVRLVEPGEFIESRRKTFDEVAEEYERFRPGYPAALIEDVIALSGIPPAGRIVEIGSGTGKATREFAARGYRLTCVESGANLVRVARRVCAGFPGVRFEVGKFEDTALEPGVHDLAIAAQSFHFLDAGPALVRIARVL